MKVSSTRFNTEMERVLFALHQLVYFTTAFTNNGVPEQIERRFAIKTLATGLVVHDRILLGKGTKVDSKLEQPLSDFLWERGKKG